MEFSVLITLEHGILSAFPQMVSKHLKELVKLIMVYFFWSDCYVRLYINVKDKKS